MSPSSPRERDDGAPWRERLTALVAALEASPRVEIRAFHLFPPAPSLPPGLPEGLRARYAETDGVQLVWADREHPGWDPTAESYTDAPAPWGADPSGWQGAIWILPSELLRDDVVDPLAGGIRMRGEELVLPDGTAGPAADVLGHLIRTFARLDRREGPLAREPLALSEVLPSEEDVERGVSLAVSVLEVRRTSPEDALWSWADHGLDTDQISERWARPDGSAPAEVVELELEIEALPASLVPWACSEALVRQLLGPWGYPARFVASVDLTERPRWTIAFAAAPAPATDELTVEATEDTEIRPVDAPPVASGPLDEDARHAGLQFAVSVRFPAEPGAGNRILPCPVALSTRWTATAFPGGRTWALAASPDGLEVAAIAESGEVRLWLAAGGEVAVERQAEPESFSELGFGPDGRLALWDGNLVARWEADGAAAGFVHQRMAGIEGFEAGDVEFALWANRPVFLDLRGDVHGTIDALDDDLVSRSALSPDGKHMVVGTEGGQLAWYDLSPLRERWRRSTDLGEIRALAINPGQPRITVGGREAVAIYDADGGELRRLPAHDGQVTALAYIGEGRYLVSAGTDRAVRVWCTRSGALAIERVLPGIPAAVAAPPTGRWIVIGLPNRVVLLDVKLGLT